MVSEKLQYFLRLFLKKLNGKDVYEWKNKIYDLCMMKDCFQERYYKSP